MLWRPELVETIFLDVETIAGSGETVRVQAGAANLIARQIVADPPSASATLVAWGIRPTGANMAAIVEAGETAGRRQEVAT